MPFKIQTAVQLLGMASKCHSHLFENIEKVANGHLTIALRFNNYYESLIREWWEKFLARWHNFVLEKRGLYVKIFEQVNADWLYTNKVAAWFFPTGKKLM